MTARDHMAALPDQTRVLASFSKALDGRLMARDDVTNLLFQVNRYWTRMRVDSMLKAAGYSIKDRSIDYQLLLAWAFDEHDDYRASSTLSEVCGKKDRGPAAAASQSQIMHSEQDLTILSSPVQSESTKCQTSPSSIASPRHNESGIESSAGVSAWQPGDLVDRLVDDMGDIWTGAIIRATYPGDLYDIEYEDTDAVEQGVEGAELRRRQPAFLLDAEFWARTCEYICDGRTLSAVEQVERSARSAVVFEASTLWSVCYHCMLGKCGTRCALQSSVSSFEPAQVSRVAAECVRVAADPLQSPLSRQRRPWKERYAERYMDLQSELVREEHMMLSCEPFSLGGSPQSMLDGRLRFGADALRGSAFDPMLGRMVAEDGSDRGPVVIRRGRTWYSH